MADLKISQLTSATLPLAGTEVLPIVQSSTTKKVATDDLTVKNIRSNATTGILQIAGPAAASTRTMTVPDANFSAARIDAAQSFTGDQTLSTGNLVIGTSGKGIDFSATPGSGTSELFADYEEGTFTPNIGGTATYTTQVGKYTKVGRIVTCFIRLTINQRNTGSDNTISGLPFTSVDSGQAQAGTVGYFGTIAVNSTYVSAYVANNTTTMQFTNTTAATATMTAAAALIDSGADFIITMTYETA